MAAGSVSAPLIIPIIHLQTHRAKNHINTNTPVAIQSGTNTPVSSRYVSRCVSRYVSRCVSRFPSADTTGVQIFFTLDGSKPAAVQRGSAGSNRKYSEPILLPAGRVAVRAVAITR